MNSGVRQTPESFWAQVNIGSKDECWEWQGACNNTGYGTVSWSGVRCVAHRLAAWLSGLVPTLLKPDNTYDLTHVLHTCDNRKCCNPNHFFLGSYSDNQLDAYRKGRRAQPRGEHHANAKLTMEQAKIIREQYKKGAQQIPLSMEYGVSQRTISLIVRNETYKEA